MSRRPWNKPMTPEERALKEEQLTNLIAHRRAETEEIRRKALDDAIEDTRNALKDCRIGGS